MTLLLRRVPRLSRLAVGSSSRRRDVDTLGEQRGVILTLTHDANSLTDLQGGEGVDGCGVLIPSLPGLPARQAVVVGVGAGVDGQLTLLGGEDEGRAADRLDRPLGDVALLNGAAVYASMYMFG